MNSIHQAYKTFYSNTIPFDPLTVMRYDRGRLHNLLDEDQTRVALRRVLQLRRNFRNGARTWGKIIQNNWVKGCVKAVLAHAIFYQWTRGRLINKNYELWIKITVAKVHNEELWNLKWFCIDSFYDLLFLNSCSELKKIAERTKEP